MRMRPTMRRLIWVSLLLSALAYGGSTSGQTSGRMPALSAQSWPEADLLFRNDPSWLGADDAYSIDLGNGRVLWLFADTFIALRPGGTRHQSKMIRNSVAIQRGYDPSSASIKFYWRATHGKPASFFGEQRDVWYWPGDGIVVGGRLLIFLMKIHETKTGLGFEAFGWAAVAVDNPHDEPLRWRVRWLDAPANGLNVIIGSASLVRAGDFVYAFSAQEPVGKHDVYLVRWPVDRAAEGDLREPFWWCGSDQWVKQTQLKQEPAIVFSEAQTEFTVHFDSTLKRYIQIQTVGFGAASVASRSSSEITGSWSGLEPFYRPPESDRAGILVYAGKAHPELKGADLILTYVANHSNFGALVDDRSIYYPRFLKARFGAN
ncbi:MAG TPA: DUF4185 domain-containing protein [Pyrinomonadaceae bacterium]|nr:DUF4185 domain-containing protein [Pyrinomonadaceae bacterium]